MHKPVERPRGRGGEPGAPDDRGTEAQRDIIVVTAPTIKDKLMYQGMLHAARLKGPEDRDAIRVVDYLATHVRGFRNVDPDRQRESLMEAVGGDVDAKAIYVKDERGFVRNANEIRESLREGDMKDVVKLLKAVEGRVHRDEYLFYKGMVDDYAAEHWSEGPKPEGWSDYEGIRGEVEDNPLMRRGKQDVGLGRRQIELVEASIEAYNRAASPMLQGMDGETQREASALTSWMMIDEMSEETRLETVERLRRVSESDIGAGVKTDVMGDIVGRGLNIEVEKTMLSWVDEGPETFFKNISYMEGAWMFSRPPQEEVDEVKGIVDSLPEGDGEQFLKTYVRLIKIRSPIATEDPDRKNPTRRRYVRDVKHAVDSGDEFGWVIGRYHYRAMVNGLVNELDLLPSDGKLRLITGLYDLRGNAETGDDMKRVAQVLEVCERMDPAHRLPSVSEMLVATEFLWAAAGKKPGAEAMYTMSLVASNHEHLENLFRYTKMVDDRQFRKMVGELADTSAQPAQTIEGVREDSYAEEYGKMLDRGEVEGLSEGEIDRQKHMFSLYGILADDIRYMDAVGRAANSIADVSPGAAKAYWNTYYVEPAETLWDGSLNEERMAVGELVDSVGRITDHMFIGAFVEHYAENPGSIERVNDLDGMKIRGESLSKEVALAMGRSPEHLKILGGDTIDKLADNYHGGRYLVEEFLDSLKNDELNMARAYDALLHADNRTAQKLRNDYLRGGLADADLEGVELTAENIGDELERVAGEKKAREDAERRFRQTVSKELGAVGKDYLHLADAVPVLRTPEHVESFGRLYSGVGERMRSRVVGLALDAAERRKTETAAEIMESADLASKLESLSKTPYAANNFMDVLYAAALTSDEGEFDAGVRRVFRLREIQEALVVEGVLDFTGVKDEMRGDAVEMVLNTPLKQRPFLTALPTSEMLEHGEGLRRFMDENPHIVEAMSNTVYVEARENGRTYVLGGGGGE